MSTRTFIFDNERDASWFIAGVTFANDSALTFDGEGPSEAGGYMVVFEDEDGVQDTTRDYREIT